MMRRIEGRVRHYAWGSRTRLPRFLGLQPDGRNWAEAWFGGHPLAPSLLEDGTTLSDLVASEPQTQLGVGVARSFGSELPFLLKAIAPEKPLSLQVHPGRDRAEESFAAETAAGLPLDSVRRSYRDPKHKPELLVALEPFTALCGFRAPRRAIEILEGLDTDLSERLHRLLLESPNARGMHAALRSLLSRALRPEPGLVRQVVEACRERERTGASPSPRMDRIVTELADHHPGDPGVVAALLLNPVALQPGEALFIPTGTLHAYISGFGIEVTAASDNVLRAGLTEKPLDVDELLQCVNVAAAPPLRIAPERRNEVTQSYYAPVDDFEVSYTTLVQCSPRDSWPLIGRGPRIVLGLEGLLVLESSDDAIELRAGQAVFIPASDGTISVRGIGRIVQACVP
ncbi:mannose-6-phosphate isomerase, class I [Brachybacterium subflavum]|uniref:mannose-6-phosphate isomerase, class I n=1 Tax=Brachybacterium subflavum TaxID=2585206 RepID=UPI0029D418D9|nr:mannose-6-phosphate isomerase, class I [Brachybacterium subflavum]